VSIADEGLLDLAGKSPEPESGEEVIQQASALAQKFPQEHQILLLEL
jgi:hypothetical protein